MEIQNLQKVVDKWIKEHGIRYFDPLTNLAQLTEEVGEVARIISRKYGEQSEKYSDKKKDLAEELSDVLFVNQSRTLGCWTQGPWPMVQALGRHLWAMMQ